MYCRAFLKPHSCNLKLAGLNAKHHNILPQGVQRPLRPHASRTAALYDLAGTLKYLPRSFASPALPLSPPQTTEPAQLQVHYLLPHEEFCHGVRLSVLLTPKQTEDRLVHSSNKCYLALCKAFSWPLPQWLQGYWYSLQAAVTAVLTQLCKSPPSQN